MKSYNLVFIELVTYSQTVLYCVKMISLQRLGLILFDELINSIFFPNIIICQESFLKCYISNISWFIPSAIYKKFL